MMSEEYFIQKSNRLISQYSSAELLKDIQKTILEEIFVLKELIESLPELQSITKSKGQLLDLAGSTRSISRRDGDDDETYRSIILATIAAQNSKSKMADIKLVIRLLLPGQRDIRVFSYGQRTIKVEIDGPIPESLQPILLNLLSLSIGAGRRIAILLETRPNIFRFGVEWGKGFAKPVRSRSFDRYLNFIIPASQKRGVFLLADSTGTWTIQAKGTVEPWPDSRPPNGPLGLVPPLTNSDYIDPSSSLGRLIIRRNRTSILPYTDNLRINVKKGDSLEFFVNDSFFDDNRGAFEIEIGVKNG